ncbi:histidine kinase [Phreatobacter sp.]|nr:histidine kinase [Phreatobacter sp.]MCZ8316746.1 histidine kinase [Phreatobacter sp.]
MPTLFRFITILLVLAGLGFSGMLALAYLVDPEPREMSVQVPPARLQPRR